MVINTKALLDGVAILTDDHNVRVTVKQSARGALVCGASCFVGGLLAGPVGMAIGGTIGGLQAYRMTNGQFRALGTVIREDLTYAQRTRLSERIMAVAQDFDISDVVVLLPMLLNSVSMQQAVLKSVVSFVTNEMHMQILD